MKFSILLMSLLFICFSRNILGHIEIPYNQICYHNRVKGDDVLRKELAAANSAVEKNIKDKMKTEGKPAKDYIDKMCFEDSKIKSLSEKLIDKVCTSKINKSKEVQDLIFETCGMTYNNLVVSILWKYIHHETPSDPSVKKEI